MTPGATSPPRVEVLGLPIDPLTMDETVARVREIVHAGRPVQHVVVNVAKLVAARRDPELARIIRTCGLINADGQAIVWAGRLLGASIPERVAGIDLMCRLVEESARQNWPVYFLGAREEIVRRIVETFQTRHPTLPVAGWRNGYFTEAEEDTVAETIRRSGARLLFVAIGSPKKERFLARWTARMGIPFTMGVGGSFDVVAGLVKRAPLWMQRTGLEWLFRLLSEPRRMWKRYLFTNTIFCALLARATAARAIGTLTGKIRHKSPKNKQ